MMADVVVKFTEEEKALLIKHLHGMSALYVRVNGSGDGPLGRLIIAIKGAQLVMKFDHSKAENLLRHLEGASSSDKAVHGSDPLGPILVKIKHEFYR
jgi:hypothetical protein